jgi:hypothetical protein
VIFLSVEEVREAAIVFVISKSYAARSLQQRRLLVEMLVLKYTKKSCQNQPPHALKGIDILV